jgi:hypothetical protein
MPAYDPLVARAVVYADDGLVTRLGKPQTTEPRYHRIERQWSIDLAIEADHIGNRNQNAINKASWLTRDDAVV